MEKNIIKTIVNIAELVIMGALKAAAVVALLDLVRINTEVSFWVIYACMMIEKAISFLIEVKRSKKC